MRERHCTNADVLLLLLSLRRMRLALVVTAGQIVSCGIVTCSSRSFTRWKAGPLWGTGGDHDMSRCHLNTYRAQRQGTNWHTVKAYSSRSAPNSVQGAFARNSDWHSVFRAEATL